MSLGYPTFAVPLGEGVTLPEGPSKQEGPIPTELGIQTKIADSPLRILILTNLMS